MRPSVRSGWPDSITGYEGRCSWMYPDSNGEPTTGTGNKIGTKGGLSSFGLALPWQDRDGNYATEAQVAGEWRHLSALGVIGSGYAYEKYATLFLDDPVLDWLLASKTAEFWTALASVYTDIEDWPACAQLALLNLAWWVGYGDFPDGWPTLSKALRAEDFYAASRNCTTVNSSQRNPDNACRFETAARIVYAGLDRDVLWNANLDDAKDPLYPRHPLGMGAALLTVRALDIATTIPTVVSAEGWYFQRWLKLAPGGPFYTGSLDGLVGPMTLTGFGKWATKYGQKALRTQPVLQLLSNQVNRMKVT